MKSRLIGTLLGTLLIVGLVAPAAVAGDLGVGVISGASAEVGRMIERCTKDVQDAPSGNGITLPVTADGNPGNSGEFKYRLQIPNAIPGQAPGTMRVAGVVLPPNNDNGKSTLEPRVGNATLSICGNVGPVKTVASNALGAWCGLSKGYGGTGKLNVTWDAIPPGADAVQKYQLSDVTWKASAGTVLPVIGKWRKLNDAGNKKKNIWGNLVAVVSARAIQGTSTCATAGTGGQVFNVDGVTALVSAGDKSKSSVVRPNEQPGTCKGGALCLYDPKGKPTPTKDNVPNNS